MKRSQWKGPLINSQDITQKLPILSRNYEITSQISGLVCNVHSGKKYVKLTLNDQMIGHKLGEFVPTRERFEFKKKRKKK